MDKGGVNEDSSSISGTGSSNSSSANLYLKQLNKSSLKIAKPIRKATIPDLEPNPQHLPPSQQPPVYNVNKNDFREVVQKLTGSPAHERFPAPISTPVTQTRPSSSRLQRIRPPPLAQIGNRPPPVNDLGQRSEVQSFTPLPPLPSVHPAAESPISAYMRFLHSSSSSPAVWNDVVPQLPATESPMSNYMRFLQSSSTAASPRWNAGALPVLPQQQTLHPPPPFPSFTASLSPLPFGCLPLPRSPYAVFSPTGQLGFPQLPSSPVQSPRVKGI